MAATPYETKQRIIDYYVATTEDSYLPNWAGESLGFHFGLADETTQSLAESLLNSNAFLAERAEIARGTRVLDAGCGVCGSAIWLAQNKGARVTGITLVERQVQLARQFIRQRGVENLVAAEQRDMADTGFPERTFDVVWNLESMCHVVDLDAYFEHIALLLKDGGRFACIDLCGGPTRDPKLESIVCDGWAMAPMRSPADISAALARHDFEDVETVDLTDRAMLSGRALEAMANRSLLKIRAEQTFLGETFPIYEGHVRAALAMVDGMRSGRTNVTHFLAKRKRRC
jgi:tocopherol O-methyltransferase